MSDTALSFIDSLRGRHELRDLPGTLSTLLLTPRFKASRHVIFLVMAAGQSQPILVAKIPRVAQLSDALAREAHILQTVQTLRPQGFGTIPRVIAYQEHHGYPILLETAINGPLMTPELVRTDPKRMIRMAGEWLLDVQSHPTQPNDDRWYPDMVLAPLSVLQHELALRGAELDLLEKCEDHLAVLRDCDLPYVLEHGDLGHPNLIVMERDTLGVIDWELAKVHGLMAADLFFFLAYIAFSVDRANESGEYIHSFRKAFFGDAAWTRPHVDAFVADIGIAPDAVAALFLLCWVRYLAQYVERLRVHADRPIGADAVQAIRNNRFFMIWKYAVENFEQLSMVVDRTPHFEKQRA